MIRSQTIPLLRAAKGLSQQDVAQEVGITQPQLSLIENGRRDPDEVLEAFLDRALALGEEREDEDPVYSLAQFGKTGGWFDLIPDADGRLGIYRRSTNAELAESLIRKGAPHANVMMVPVWLSYAALDVVRRRGAVASQQDLYVVDAENDDAVTIEIAKHAVGVVATLGHADSYEAIAEAISRQLFDRESRRPRERRYITPGEDEG